MPVALLAPVPALHLPAAKKTCDAQGRVAFGSKAWETLSEAWQTYGRIPVLIVPTASGDGPPELLTPGRVSYCAILEGITPAMRNGRHPNDALRPATALAGDTKWGFFWEVSNLHPLESQISVTMLRALKQRKTLPADYVARGPLLVMMPEMQLA